MGTWGVGIFDNDGAADWAYELERNGESAIVAALDIGGTDGYLDAYYGERALAAADVVARLRSGGGEATAYAEAVVAWVEAHRHLDPSPWIEASLASIARVRGADSELRALWDEAEDLTAAWLATLGELERRLKA